MKALAALHDRRQVNAASGRHTHAADTARSSIQWAVDGVGHVMKR
jgi:hypothetical protein